MEAMALFETMLQKGLRPTVVTFNALIKACIPGRKVEVASQVWKEMVRQEIDPNEYTFVCMIHVCVREHIEKALQLLPNSPTSIMDEPTARPATAPSELPSVRPRQIIALAPCQALTGGLTGAGTSSPPPAPIAGPAPCHPCPPTSQQVDLVREEEEVWR